LTGLANRSLFSDRLRHGLELHRRDLRPITLLYCDLDGFKNVNDTLGHDAGDAVIKSAAERLQAVTRRGDTVARLGGDEFAILIEDDGDAATTATRILDGFARPVVIDTHTLAVGVSIGIAILDAASAPVTPTELLRRADFAMYEAKRNGKGTASTWRHTSTEQPAR
jgi:diguanylate cyclase (GGDEF)-like protein